MSIVNAKCTNCGKIVCIDDRKEANICSNCNQAFITDKAIKLYNENLEKGNHEKTIKRKHRLKSLGRGLLMVLECIGYLFYVLFFIWLFVDITDSIKKK